MASLAARSQDPMGYWDPTGGLGLALLAQHILPADVGHLHRRQRAQGWRTFAITFATEGEVVESASEVKGNGVAPASIGEARRRPSPCQLACTPSLSFKTHPTSTQLVPPTLSLPTGHAVPSHRL